MSSSDNSSQSDGAIAPKWWRMGETSDKFSFTVFILLLSGYVVRRLLWLQSEHPAYHGYVLDLAGLACASFLLIIFGTVRLTPGLQRLQTVGIGALLGVIFFISTIGLGLADPTNVDWLMRGDWAQHFIGWHFYRDAAWTWPLGAFATFLYPLGTSVVYTDSLPLLAIPLKLFAPWLPARFQYIGLWLLANCVLHGVFAALLVRCFARRLPLLAIGTGLLLLAPVFIHRAMHDTLTTQWLILAGLWIYFRQGEARSALTAWLVVASIAALVHPYLSAMVLTLMLAFYCRVCTQRLLGLRTAATHVMAIIAATALCWWISGVFIMKVRSGFQPGIQNANLLTWFDSESLSRWLPALAHVGEGQYEGMGYLGVGVLFLCAVAIGLLIALRRQPALSPVPLRPLLLAVAALTLFAFSAHLTLGGVDLLDLTPKHLPILGAFRSSGRFIWTSVYLITLFAFVAVAKRAGRFALALLAIAFFAQLLDLTPLHIADARMRLGVFTREAEPVLHDRYWDEAVRDRLHITLVPPAACGAEAAPYFPFSLFAADHGMTINTGYLARFDGMRWAAYCEELRQQLDGGARDADTLYIVHPEQLEHFQKTSVSAMDCRRVEGYDACVIPETDFTSRRTTR